MEECYCIKVWKNLNVIICRRLIVWKKIRQNINIKKIEQNENVTELCKVSLLEKYAKYYLIKKNVQG